MFDKFLSLEPNLIKGSSKDDLILPDLDIRIRKFDSYDVSGGRHPFRVTFKTDGSEVTANGMTGEADETSLSPGGIIGFSLNYWELPC